MLLALFSPAFAGLLINEVVYRTGDDPDLEWIELCNSGPGPVDLSAFAIQAATGATWSLAYDPGLVGELAEGAHVVIGSGGATMSAAFSPALGNVSSDTDGVRIVDAATGTMVEDTLLYGANNTDNLVGDGGSMAFAPATGDDESLGRIADCTPGDDSSVDFEVYEAPTPGAANPAPDTDTDTDTGGGGTADCTAAPGLVINELSGVANAEFIELFYGGAAESLVLDGYSFHWATSGSLATARWAFPADAVISAGGLYTVGVGGVGPSDLEAEEIGSMPVASGDSADVLQLWCGSTPIDTVIYGPANATNTDAWMDDGSTTAATAFAEAPGAGESLARRENGVDTQRSAVDFGLTTPTPGAPNPPPPNCAPYDDVVINEFVYDPGFEFVELYNAGDADIALSGWRLSFGTQGFTSAYTLPDVTIAAGGWLVVEDDALAGLGSAANADGVQLACEEFVADTVIYAKESTTDPNGTDGWIDDTEGTCESFAPADDDEGISLSRKQDGLDSDLSGADFVLAPASPGGANPAYICDPDIAGQLKINEFLYNPDGTAAGHQWIELFNSGDTTLNIDHYLIQGGKSAWEDNVEFPAGTRIAAGAYFVVGAEEAEVTTDLVGDLDFGGGTEGDGIRVVDCEGSVLDSVLYGKPMEDGLLDDGGGSDVIGETEDNYSFGRLPDGTDTNSIDDWSAFYTPTPGAENTGGEAPPPVEDVCGCGGGADQPARPGEAGCSTVLPLGGWEAGLALLAIRRRRRA